MSTMEESSNNRVQKYLLSSYPGWSYLFESILCVLGLGLETFCVWAYFRDGYHLTSGIFVFVVLGLMLVGYLVYALFQFKKAHRTEQIEVTPDGITHIEAKNDSVFIGWNEIETFKKPMFSSGVMISDISRKKRIFINGRFENFDQIAERVLEELVKSLKLPLFPVRFGHMSLIFSILCYVLSFLVPGILFWKISNNHNFLFWISSFFVFLLLVVAVGEALTTNYKALLLEENGLILYRDFGKIKIFWDQLENIIGKFYKLKNGWLKFMVILVTKDQKAYPLIGLRQKLKIYITLRKILEERQMQHK
jgi:hypothetical protein